MQPTALRVVCVFVVVLHDITTWTVVLWSGFLFVMQKMLINLKQCIDLILLKHGDKVDT